MNVLVTGGAGYIGSHAVSELLNSGHSVIVLDDFSKGHKESIDPRALLVIGSTADKDLIKKLSGHKIEAVMHFAASIEVSESVIDPLKYYQNNFANTLNLINFMMMKNIKKIIFSSTAAVYGNPLTIPISEDSPLLPINPYGKSKMMTEMLLEDCCKAYGLGYVILRYFNVAGASIDGSIGEDHRPESHLIPRILASARDHTEVKIYGTDYDTHDGTCVRDYVHVIDLAHAHVLALEKVEETNGSVFNIGSEKGFSVREVISACEKITKKKISVVEAPRRPGDPPILVASSDKIRSQLKWQPKYPQIKSMVEHAWAWHSRNPKGYAGPSDTKLSHSDEAQPKNFPLS